MPCPASPYSRGGDMESPVLSSANPNGLVSLGPPLSGFEINTFAEQPAKPVCYTFAAMFNLLRLWFGAVIRIFRAQRSLMLENLALRQQLAVLTLRSGWAWYFPSLSRW